MNLSLGRFSEPRTPSERIVVHMNKSEIDAIEWSLGLEDGTLDIRFHGTNTGYHPSPRREERNKAWVILPEESMVARFFHDTHRLLVRKGKSFPTIVDIFSYTVVYLGDMDTLTTCRTQKLSDASIGRIIKLKSHIHPTDAILKTGSTLVSFFDIHARKSLYERFPVLDKIFFLYARWLTPRPGSVLLPSAVQREQSLDAWGHQSACITSGDSQASALIQEVDGTLQEVSLPFKAIHMTPGGNCASALIAEVNGTLQETSLPFKAMPLAPDSLTALNTKYEWDPPFWNDDSISLWASYL